MNNLLIAKAKAEDSALANFLKNFNKEPKDQSFDTINLAVKNITTIALSFAGVIAVIFFLYGCFLYMTSFGDDTKAESAKKTILYSVIGIVVIMVCELIVNVITDQIK